jgi:hypothetical protein
VLNILNRQQAEAPIPAVVASGNKVEETSKPQPSSIKWPEWAVDKKVRAGGTLTIIGAPRPVRA